MPERGRNVFFFFFERVILTQIPANEIENVNQLNVNLGDLGAELALTRAQQAKTKETMF
jgi:hypothetical protein